MTDFAVKDKILYVSVGQSEMMEMEGEAGKTAPSAGISFIGSIWRRA